MNDFERVCLWVHHNFAVSSLIPKASASVFFFFRDSKVPRFKFFKISFLVAKEISCLDVAIIFRYLFGFFRYPS